MKNKNIDYNYKIPSKFNKSYKIPIIIIVLYTIGFLIQVALIFFKKWSVGITFIYFIIGFGIIGLSSLVLFIKAYLDRRTIKNNLVKFANKNNCIIANFFTQHKVTEKKIIAIETDGISFKTGKETYIIDLDCVWKDTDGFSNLYYIKGLPNPLKFGFSKDIKTFLENLIKDEKLQNKNPLDCDVSYSSENLQKFKSDKFLEELHRPIGSNETRNIIIVVIIFAVLFAIFFIFGRKENVIVLAQNLTGV